MYKSMIITTAVHSFSENPTGECINLIVTTAVHSFSEDPTEECINL